METIRKIRLAISGGMSIRAAARKFNKSRETIRKIMRTGQTRFTYERQSQPYPALGAWLGHLDEALAKDLQQDKARHRSALSFFEELQGLGFEGSYSSVRRYCVKWREQNGSANKAFIPQVFEKGEAFQFDWSTETIEIGGVKQTINVAHIRLCHSRMSFIACYPLQKLEMVMDAHIKAHEFFGGLCKRGIYDNLKSVVKKIGKGKKREFNEQMLELSSHYLFELVACNPSAGWEKGQVERQVKTLRQRIFEENLSFPDFESLQSYVEGRLIALAKKTTHPEYSGRTIYEIYEEERAYLVNAPSAFDGYMRRYAMASSTCLVNYNRNQYSVPCKYASKPLEIRASAWKIKICHEGHVICEHARCFDKKRIIIEPLHYLPVLKRKPGALRNGRPFREWKLPESIEAVKNYLILKDDGERQVVEILCAILTYGLEAVEVACELALERNAICKSIILNYLGRVSEEIPDPDIDCPSALELKNPPVADCFKYESLLEGCHVA